jgi:hypothetical protein
MMMDDAKVNDYDGGTKIFEWRRKLGRKRIIQRITIKK